MSLDKEFFVAASYDAGGDGGATASRTRMGDGSVIASASSRAWSVLVRPITAIAPRDVAEIPSRVTAGVRDDQLRQALPHHRRWRPIQGPYGFGPKAIDPALALSRVRQAGCGTSGGLSRIGSGAFPARAPLRISLGLAAYRFKNGLSQKYVLGVADRSRSRSVGSDARPCRASS